MNGEDVPQRTSGGTFLLAAVAFAASAGGAFWYYERFSTPKSAVVDKSGFDIAEVARPVEKSAASPASPSQSGLGMIAAVPGLQFGQKQPAPAANAAANPASLANLVRATEAKIAALAMDYTRRYPVIRQYGRDWMGYPDLRKLNNDYMRDHDPFAFIKGLGSSPNFGNLVRKYAKEKPIRDFVMDGVKTSPPEAMPTVLEYVNKDDKLKGLTDNVAKSLGLPPGLLSSAAGEGSRIDEKKVLQQVIGSNPELQQALSEQEAQKR